MQAEHGLTLGKFLPLHVGHELLLQTAVRFSRSLTILVGTTEADAISFAIRKRWIEQFLAPWLADSATRVHILADPDPDALVAKDSAGTVIDEAYWTQWLAQNARILAPVDCVFTSDRYGSEIARRISAEWFPVDPERELFPISASAIRAEPGRYFGQLSRVAKAELALAVAVVGAESAGKSTLTKRLADTFETSYAPEWGRTLSEAKDSLDARDFSRIVAMQNGLIDAALSASSELFFTDTEAITTALFAPIYLGEEHSGAWAAAREQSFDLYLVLAPTVKWVDDGTRILDEPARQAFHERLLAALARLDKRCVVIDYPDHERRFEAAVGAVRDLLAERRWTL